MGMKLDKRASLGANGGYEKTQANSSGRKISQTILSMPEGPSCQCGGRREETTRPKRGSKKKGWAKKKIKANIRIGEKMKRNTKER